MALRPLLPGDRDRVRELVIAAGNFNETEIETAVELVDEALADGDASGYFFLVLEEDGDGDPVRGYACYGPVPLTEGVFDLYWIVVHPQAQGKGYGRLLLESVEREVRAQGGRKLLIETSSQASYAGTIRFYERSGYDLAARIRDFYKVGDDKLVFSRDFPRGR